MSDEAKQRCEHIADDAKFFYLEMPNGSTEADAKKAVSDYMGDGHGVDYLLKMDTLHKCAPHPLKKKEFWVLEVEE